MPKKGDLTICLGCGAIAVFDERSRLRRPTIEELHECDGRGMFDLLWSSYLVRFGDYLTEEAPHAHDA